MRRYTFVLLIFVIFLPPSAYAQVSISGLADFELRSAGDDSSPYVNQTPGEGLSLYTPNLRLFIFGDISEQWFVNAVLQSDHYSGKELSDPFFSVFNINWTPSLDSDYLITAGRFVTPYGSYSTRFLSSENPFVHLPLSHASGLPLSKTFGFTGDARTDPAMYSITYGDGDPGMTMVYQRMYTQGLQFTYSAGDSDWLELQLAASLAPASSHLDYGESDKASLIGRLSVQPVFWAKAGVSFSQGAFLKDDSASDSLLIYDLSSYKQNLIGADITLNYRYYTLVVEWNQSFWKAPYYDTNTSNASSPRTGKATLDHLSGELKIDLPFLVGSYIAGRYEYMTEGEIEIYERDANDEKISQTFTDWTYDRNRLEIAAGYKLARNILLKSSYLISDDNGPELDDNVFTVQLSVLF